MSGAALFFAAGGSLAVKTLTVGDDGVPQSYGYNSGSYGSLAPSNTYNDRSGASRTILTLSYNTATGALVLTLSGTVGNDNNAFIGLLVGDVFLSRASATYSNPANSIWTWTPGSNVIGTTGTKVVQLT